MASLANTEIVFEGWLVKSPPTKRIWRAKWRRRWFVLKQTGELPGQYFLEYYTDRTCRKLKGKIDLDQCEQVDSGLTIESRKQRYAHMFDIRTPKRVYFLAADSEEDMNSWVGCICHVCGLKVFYREEEEEANAAALTLTRPVSTSSSSASTTTATTMAANQQLARTLQTNHLALGEDTPPTSPVSPTGSSGPYFPLSECLSGSRSLFFSEVLASSNQPSSAPVTPAPTARGLGLGTQSLRGKPRREDWDLFYDQPRQLGQQTTAGQTTHSHQQILRENDDQDIHDTIRGLEEKFVRSFKKLLPTGGQKQAPVTGGGHKFVPPPRPPKPPHLSDQPSHNYLNLDQLHSGGGGGRTHSRSSSPRSPPSISPPLPTPTNPDAWYDFPRSHQGDHHSVSAVNSPAESKGEGGHSRRHCYTNAAPGEMLKSASATSTTAEVFTFNSSHQNAAAAAAAATAISPSVYSNLASPFPLASPALLPMTPFSPPPSVNRTLKPKKTGSGSSESAAPPPSVNRQLKPHRPVSGIGPHPELQGGSSSDDAEDPSSRGSSRPNSAHDDEQINNNPTMAGGGHKMDEIQYLDLDLESDSSLQSPKSPERGVLMHSHHHTLPHHHHHSHHSHHQASSTVYKTVDFIKTEAFNRTRLKVEVDRYKKAQ